MARKAIAEHGIDAPDITVPGGSTAGTIVDISKELLIPANCSKKIGRDFVFCFQVIHERVGVANVRHLIAGEENFAPNLPMPPLVTDVLYESDLIVITNAFSGGEIGALLYARK